MKVKPSYDAALPSLEALFQKVPLPPIANFLDAVEEKDTLRLLRLAEVGAPINGYVVPPLLVIAAGVDRPKELEELLARGADVNAGTLSGVTPLMAAAKRGRFDVVELLVKQGADINAGDESGRTALMRAAYEGSADIVEYLIERGAKAGQKDANGKTALEWAKEGARKEYREFERHLKKEECDCYRNQCRYRHESIEEMEQLIDSSHYRFRAIYSCLKAASKKETTRPV